MIKYCPIVIRSVASFFCTDGVGALALVGCGDCVLLTLWDEADFPNCFAPQWVQNAASSGICLPQFSQNIVIPP
jgi:hypothetical protein